MRYLIILNDAPYGTERTYNGLRLAKSLADQQDTVVSIFLIGDAVASALTGQTTPNGYYNIERMLKVLAAKQASIGICGSCMDARGVRPELMVAGAKRSSMEELTQWTQAADQVLVF